MKNPLRWLGFGAGMAAAACGAYAGANWFRYGHPAKPKPEESDHLLDRFMPEYEVVERHHIRVHAPAEVTFDTACGMDLMQSGIIRAIFRLRELILGGKSPEQAPPPGLLAQVQAGGWGVLGSVPGREVVVGSVTQPWVGDVVFWALPPEEFVNFHEPGYAKIAFTLRADPVGPDESVFRTETRVATTDSGARARFRAYWTLVSAGVGLIRRLSLGPLKAAAERRDLLNQIQYAR